MSRYVDVLSFQLYPSPRGSPEESIMMLQDVRGILAKHRVTKPIYDTEINYGPSRRVQPGDRRAPHLDRRALNVTISGVRRPAQAAQARQRIPAGVVPVLIRSSH